LASLPYPVASVGHLTELSPICKRWKSFHHCRLCKTSPGVS